MAGRVGPLSVTPNRISCKAQGIRVILKPNCIQRNETFALHRPGRCQVSRVAGLGNLSYAPSMDNFEILRYRSGLGANLTFGVGEGVPEAEAEVEEVLEKVNLSRLVKNVSKGLETVVGDQGIQLSGGERQRVAIPNGTVSGAERLEQEK